MSSNTDQKRPAVGTETVKLDAATLRKLVVSTVVTITDDDEVDAGAKTVDSAAADDAAGPGASSPRH